jgi:hypothetical protein
MAKHTLSLEIPDTLNDCILRVIDTSLYADKPPVDCPYLDVQGPGFSCAVRLDVEPGFCNLNLTACDLELQTENCGTIFNTLPDGVYVIRYSIAPNEYVFVEYNHLRTTEALNKLNEVLCALDVSNCDPLPEVKEKLKELRLIEMLLKAAKAKVEYCHNPSQGMDLYDYAKKRLDKLACTVCI